MPTSVTYILSLIILLFHSLIYGEAIKCSVCDTKSDGVSCILKPPHPSECESFYQHCLIVTRYAVDGALESLTRSCSPVNFGDMCMKGVDTNTGKRVLMCTRYCSKNDCNALSNTAFLLSLIRN